MQTRELSERAIAGPIWARGHFQVLNLRVVEGLAVALAGVRCESARHTGERRVGDPGRGRHNRVEPGTRDGAGARRRCSAPGLHGKQQRRDRHRSVLLVV